MGEMFERVSRAIMATGPINHAAAERAARAAIEAIRKCDETDDGDYVIQVRTVRSATNSAIRGAIVDALAGHFGTALAHAIMNGTDDTSSLSGILAEHLM